MPTSVVSDVPWVTSVSSTGREVSAFTTLCSDSPVTSRTTDTTAAAIRLSRPAPLWVSPASLCLVFSIFILLLFLTICLFRQNWYFLLLSIISY